MSTSSNTIRHGARREASAKVWRSAPSLSPTNLGSFALCVRVERRRTRRGRGRGEAGARRGRVRVVGTAACCGTLAAWRCLFAGCGAVRCGGTAGHDQRKLLHTPAREYVERENLASYRSRVAAVTTKKRKATYTETRQPPRETGGRKARPCRRPTPKPAPLKAETVGERVCDANLPVCTSHPLLAAPAASTPRSPRHQLRPVDDDHVRPARLRRGPR